MHVSVEGADDMVTATRGGGVWGLQRAGGWLLHRLCGHLEIEDHPMGLALGGVPSRLACEVRGNQCLGVHDGVIEHDACGWREDAQDDMR